MAWRVDQIRMEEPDREKVFGFHLDAPRAGDIVDGSSIEMIGWALARGGPAIAVELVSDDRVVCRQAMNVARLDLSTAFPDLANAHQGGFHLTAMTNGKESDAWTLQAVLPDQQRVSIARLSLSRIVPVGTNAAMVSVIIPSFNHSPFLSEAIESALRQNYPQFEVIVVDDGSSDNTTAVAHRYSTVRLVRQENAGLSAARNAGIRQSRGDYLVFLDADDRMLPNALEAGVKSLDATPKAAFAFGRFRQIDLLGRTISASSEPTFTGRDCYLALLRGNFIAMHATVMYRRAVLPAEPFDSSLPSAEDYDLYLRLASHHPVVSHDEVVSEYRQHGSNMSHDDGRMLSGSLQALARQKSRATRSPEALQAYVDGVKFWRALYGDRLVETTREQWRERRYRRAVRSAAVLLRHYPSGLRRILRRDISPASNEKVPAIKPSDLLLRAAPLNRNFGAARGKPIDRYYIESFLSQRSADVRGRVLEIGDNEYTVKFGGERVSHSDVLHVHSGNPRATIVADLSDAPQIPDNTFDCIILTQTLQCIFDSQRAIQTLHRILKPGGVALITVPGISQLADDEWGKRWYWNFTPLSIETLLKAQFAYQISIQSSGSVLTATAFLNGLAVEDLNVAELSRHDPAYPLVICARAVKSPEGGVH